MLSKTCFDAYARLCGNEKSVGGIDADDVFDLFFHPFGIGGRQVDLVDDGEDFEVAVDRQMDVGQSLRLDPLDGVDDEKGPFAGGERAGHFVGEIDVAGGVDQVDLIGVAVLRLVIHGDGAGFDRDAPFPFQFHIVEILRLHFAGFDRVGQLEQTVGQGRFPMVDVGDDGKIADVFAVVLEHSNKFNRTSRSLQARRAPTISRKYCNKKGSYLRFLNSVFFKSFL